MLFTILAQLVLLKGVKGDYVEEVENLWNVHTWVYKPV